MLESANHNVIGDNAALAVHPTISYEFQRLSLTKVDLKERFLEESLPELLVC